MKAFIKKTALVAALAAATLSSAHANKKIELLNVSYDPTRELYQEYNPVFAKYWKEKTGDDVTIRQSHGGSGKQARSVIDGIEADVVTLALAYDIDEIGQFTQKIPEDWQTRLANNSSPYTSTIVFLVRKGNPKNLKDWDDLVKPGVSVITPNPKTSGGARWNYLAAWGYAEEKYGSAEKAEEFVKQLFKNVPVLDSGARGSTNTFVQRGLGDVLLSWENEAFLAINELGPDKFDIVVPSVSILAEPPVSLVDANAKRRGTEEVSKAYLEFLYSKEGQNIAAKNYYRPSKPELVAPALLKPFGTFKTLTIDGNFGGWQKAQKDHFSDGGSFDKIYLK